MKLEYALMAMRDGEQIRRSAWEDDGCRLSIVDGKLHGTAYYNPPTGVIEIREPKAFFTVDDIIADDWEVVGKHNRKVRTCDTCRHSIWIDDLAITGCKKRGVACPKAACEDYSKKEGEE